MQVRDLTPSKAERSSSALFTAAKRAELDRTYTIAAEFYEAAAELWPTGNGHFRTSDVSKLLRRAERCRSIAEACPMPEETEF